MYDSVVLPNAKTSTTAVAPPLDDTGEYDVIGSEEKEALASSKKFSFSVNSSNKANQESGKVGAKNHEDKVEDKGKKGAQNEYAFVNKKPSKEGVYNTLQHSIDSGTPVGKGSSNPVCASKLFPDQYETLGKNGLRASETSEKRMSQRSIPGEVPKAPSPPPPPLPPPISEADLPGGQLTVAQTPNEARHSQYYNAVPKTELSAEEPAEVNEVFIKQAEVETERLIQDASHNDMQEDLYMNVGANA